MECAYDRTIKSGEINDTGQLSVRAPLAKLQSTKTKVNQLYFFEKTRRILTYINFEHYFTQTITFSCLFRLVWSLTIGKCICGIAPLERENIKTIYILVEKQKCQALSQKTRWRKSIFILKNDYLNLRRFLTCPSSIMSVILDDSFHGNCIFILKTVVVAVSDVLEKWKIRGTRIYIKNC